MTRKERIIRLVIITATLILLSGAVLISVNCASIIGPHSVGRSEIRSVIQYNRSHTKHSSCNAYNDYWTKEYGCLRRYNQYFGIYRDEYFYGLLHSDGQRLGAPIVIRLYHSVYDNPYRRQ